VKEVLKAEKGTEVDRGGGKEAIEMRVRSYEREI
jgi:hypothetical protein